MYKIIKKHDELFAALSYNNKNDAGKVELMKRVEQAMQKNLLSIDVTDLNVWNGTDSAQINVFALRGTPSIANGAVSLLTTEPRGKTRIPTMSLKGTNPTGRQVPSCDPTPLGGVEMSDVEIEDFEIMSYTEFCHRDLENTIFQSNANLEGPISMNVFDAITFLFTESRKEENEFQMWTGNTAVAGPYQFADGFLKIINANVDVITPGGGAVHTASNIHAQFEIAWNNVAQGIKNQSLNWKNEIMFNCNLADQQFIDNYILQASIGTIINGFSIVGNTYYFQGIKINFSFAVTVDNIIVARPQDLWVKTTSEARWNTFEYGRKPRPSQVEWLLGNYTMGMQIRRGDFITVVKP